MQLSKKSEAEKIRGDCGIRSEPGRWGTAPKAPNEALPLVARDEGPPAAVTKNTMEVMGNRNIILVYNDYDPNSFKQNASTIVLTT